MQPQGHMQVFSRIVDYGQNPQAAIDAPRWRVHESDGTVWTEEHMPADTRDRPRGARPQAHAHPVAELRLRLEPDHLALPRGRPLSRRLGEPPRRRGGRVLMRDDRRHDRRTAAFASTAGRPTPAGAGRAIASRACCSTAAWPTPSPTTRTRRRAAPGPMPTATGTPSAARASSSPPCPPIARTACSRSASTSQGGSPQGYSWHQPWKICGFTPDGTIKPAWAARLDKVIKACDRLGMVVILGLFYGKQSGTLKDEAAVKAAVTNTVDWLLATERDQRAARDRQRGRPRERLGPSDHRRRALPRADRAGARSAARESCWSAPA